MLRPLIRIASSRAARLAIAVGLVALTAVLAMGENPAEAHSGHPLKKLFDARWYKSSVDLTVSPPWFGVAVDSNNDGFADPEYLCDGGTNVPSCISKWSDPAYVAMIEWNSQPDTARFFVQPNQNPYNDVNIYVFDSFGPPGLLGVALFYDSNANQCSPVVPSSNPPFCPTYRYGDAIVVDNNHSGPFAPAVNRKATVIHELGHLLTLRHESVNQTESVKYECGQDNTGPIPHSVMSYDCIFPPVAPYNGAGEYYIQDWDVCGINHAYPDATYEWEGCVCYPPATGGSALPGNPAYYHPITPARILDTRTGTGGFNGRLGHGCQISVPVMGVGGVPLSGVSAVVLNATVTQPSRNSFLTVYPSDVGLPTASNLNFTAGQTVPNLVTVKVGPDGKVNVYNAGGQTHVIFDAVGWYGTGGGPAGSSATATPTPPPGPPAGSVTTYQQNSLHDGQGTGQFSLPLSNGWTTPLAGSPGYPLVVNGRVFVASSDGTDEQLYALNEQTGAVLWGPVALPGIYAINGITADAANVYSVNFDGLLRAFDQATGQQAWQTQLTGAYAFTSPPSSYGGNVYVSGGGSGGTLYAVSAATGSVQWTAPAINGEHSSPAVTSDGVYVSYACEYTYRFNPLTGQQIWVHTSGCSGGGGRTAVVHGNRLYARTTGGFPHIYDLADGSVQGTLSSTYAPAFDGNLAFYTPVISGSVTLQAVDLTTGNVAWTGGGATTAPIVADGKVFVGVAGSVAIYDENTGTSLGSVYAGSTIPPSDEHNALMLTGLAAADGMLFVPATGSLVAFRSSAATPSPTPAGSGGATPTTTPTAAATLASTPTATGSTTGYYHPITPARILDTRNGTGGYCCSRMGPGQTIDVSVTNTGGVPSVASGVTAVVLNATVTDPTAGSFLTVFPSNTGLPNASNLNFSAGQTVPNLVIVKVGPDGKVKVYNAAGQTHVIFDVVGWYGGPTGGTLFRSLSPKRVLDLRTGVGGYNGVMGPGQTISPDLTNTQASGVPDGAKGLVLNVTVTGPTAPSYLTVWPSDKARPNASNLNFGAGQTVPNLVMVQVPPSGQVSFFNCCGQAYVIADVVGYFE